jgi:hypothetical protein
MKFITHLWEVDSSRELVTRVSGLLSTIDGAGRRGLMSTGRPLDYPEDDV